MSNFVLYYEAEAAISAIYDDPNNFELCSEKVKNDSCVLSTLAKQSPCTFQRLLPDKVSQYTKYFEYVLLGSGYISNEENDTALKLVLSHKIYKYFSYEDKRNLKKLFKKYSLSYFKYLSDDFRGSMDFIRSVFTEYDLRMYDFINLFNNEGVTIFDYVSPEIFKNKQNVIWLIEHPKTFIVHPYLPDELQNDEEIIARELLNMPESFEYFPESYRDIEVIAEKAVLKCSKMLHFMSSRLQNDRNFIIKLVKKCNISSFYIIEYALKKFPKDDEIISIAREKGYAVPENISPEPEGVTPEPESVSPEPEGVSPDSVDVIQQSSDSKSSDSAPKKTPRRRKVVRYKSFL